MPIVRSTANPIIRPADVRPTRPDFEVICVINAGVARLGDEILLLLRVVERPRNTDPSVYLAPVLDASSGQVVLKPFPRDNPAYNFSDPRGISGPEGNYLTALSHLRLARSSDGVHFQIEDRPALFPEMPYETYGIEDPRISLIDGVYYVQYVGVSPLGIVTALARTEDFRTFQRMGVIFAPDNKDVALFPEKIDGRYYALHRPSTSSFGKPEIWLAESPDLLCWGNHQHLIGRREEGWENGRIGASAVPFRVDAGWLEIYHGANAQNRYSLGALLLDARQPWKVLARSADPILQPEADYEVNGFFPNVVFSCGALCEDGMVKIFYGAADTCMARADIPLSEVIAGLR